MKKNLRLLIPALLLADVSIFYVTGDLGGAAAISLGAVVALSLLVSGVVWQRRMKG